MGAVIGYLREQERNFYHPSRSAASLENISIYDDCNTYRQSVEHNEGFSYTPMYPGMSRCWEKEDRFVEFNIRSQVKAWHPSGSGTSGHSFSEKAICPKSEASK